MERSPISPERWREVKRLFHDVVDLTPTSRVSAIERGEVDKAVQAEVIALLESHDGAGDFLEPRVEELRDGQTLGRYRIEERIGGGGMGDVYRAHDDQLGRSVAVKVIRCDLSDDSRENFRREARAIAALSHRNILAVHDVGIDGGRPYLVTELLEGETLRARLARGRPKVAQALDWISQIAGALATAHDKRILHRDLKPENLFVVPDGSIKILDFGLAQRVELERETPEDETQDEARTAIVGTAAYLAPEVVRGERASPATDLFALGAVAFEILTGKRAFSASGVMATISKVVNDEPPLVSTIRPEVPSWVDQIVTRLLCKDLSTRFESARDLAFTIRFGEILSNSIRPERKRWPLVLALAATLITIGAGSVLTGRNYSHSVVPARVSVQTTTPPRTSALTNSGRDKAPTVSRDGRFMAFVSDRDGRPKIWLRLLESGRERVLTEGPDEAPRFSPDGGQVLFTRASGASTALYRIDLLGGAPRKIAEDAADADWSPNGEEVVFVRWIDGGNQARPELVIASVDGSSERVLATLENRIELRPRWSPDGRWIAVTGVVQQPGAPQQVILVATDGSETRALPTPRRVGLVSGVSWNGANEILYSQAVSVLGNAAGSAAQVVRQQIDDGSLSTLLWTRESSSVLERWPGRGLVFDSRSAVQNLREVSLSDGSHLYVSRGTATDRQPVYSPDGTKIAFSSSRGGDLDLWVVDRESGEARPLTDDDGDDWDPAFTADGRRLLWSSDRGGHFEVWIADANGFNARQLSSDGEDAENPTATADGQWVVYASSAPGKKGIWKVRTDGQEATRLVADAVLPEVSPDGLHVLFQINRSPLRAVVGVARISDGSVLPFEILIEVRKPSRAREGRSRWTPDGKTIAFVGQDEDGNTGVYLQEFALEGDTSATRRPIAGFDPERVTESFDINDESVVLAEWEQRFGILSATGAALAH